MNPDLVQVAPLPVAPVDSTLRKIAELLGLNVVRVSDFAEALAIAERQADNGSQAAFLVNAAALSPTQQRLNVFVIDALRKRGRWLVYGLERDGSMPDAWIRYFGFPLPDVREKRANESLYRFAPRVPFLGNRECRGPGTPKTYVFGASVRAPLKVWVSLNGDPVLISTPLGGDDAHDYFLSAPAVDVSSALAPSASARSHLGGVLPAAIALRALCGARCWSNPFPTGCVILDGPTLRQKFGWLHYGRLLSELQAQDYSATVAFIPCNSRRSDRTLAAELASHADRFSICVHGCYGSEGEFAGTLANTLNAKALLALRHMERHAELTGLPFDRTMVFPKGGFSSAAIEALRTCGYMAAVNTAVNSTDNLDAPLTIGDTYELAVQRYANLPMFTRHLPRDPFDFAADLFFGKPVLVAGHHGIFRDGMAPLSRFVREIKSINDGTAPNPISWKPLQGAVISSGKYRMLGTDHFEVQFATTEFRVQNPARSQARLECWKPEPHSDDVDSVTIDGTPCDFLNRDRRIRFELVLLPGQARTVRLNRRPRNPKPETLSPAFTCKALILRRIAELRDLFGARFR